MDETARRDTPSDAGSQTLAERSLSKARVVRELSALIRIYGKPGCIVSDNGTKFTSRAIFKSADENTVPLHYTDLGKPQQKAFIESVYGCPRDDLLKEEIFDSIDEARRKTAL